MKRTIELEHTSAKMLKWNVTELENMDISDVTSISGSRRFNFKLTDQKAKKNLLKSAHRQHFQVEEKQNCQNLRFSPGAYLMVAKKMIEQCEVRFKNNSTYVYEDLQIKVDEFRAGHELNNKHFDTKVTFSVNNQKVVMHCYNSTQNLKVDGIAHSYFVKKFLEPLFRIQVDEFKTEIDQYDKNVLSSLGGGCSEKLKDKEVATTPKPLGSSTRNNSFSNELLLCEDMSLEMVEKSEVVEIVENTSGSPSRVLDSVLKVLDPKQTTEICVLCDFKSYDKSSLENHIQTEHATVEESFECMNCHEIFNSKLIMEEHECYKCGKCTFTANSASKLEIHKQSLHTKITVDVAKSVYLQCELCEYMYKYNIQLKKHMEACHVEATSEPKYRCRDCDYKSHYYLYIWEHREKNHSSQSEHCASDQKDMALALIAEQNIDAYYQVESMKKELEDKFNTLKEHIDVKIEAIRKDLKIANAIHLDAIENVNMKSENHTENIYEKVKIVEQQANEIYATVGNGTLLNFMKDVPKVQNEIKQELFLIRNQSKTISGEKSNKNPDSRHESYSDVVSKSKEKESRRNIHERDNRKIYHRREKSLNRGDRYKSYERSNRQRNFDDRRYNLSQNRDRPQYYVAHRDRFSEYRQNNRSRFHGEFDRQRNRPLYRDYQSSERWPRHQHGYGYSNSFYDRNPFRENPYSAGFDLPVYNRFSPLGNY